MTNRANIFSSYNYLLPTVFDVDIGTSEPISWRIECSYALGNWIETQDMSEWTLLLPRHLSVYIISDDILSKIKMMAALTETHNNAIF